ncbi:MAG: ABC transporter substrate-binding protein, partial [Dehalococcoidia bacterium]|nr:ABC transporter substrate-binding protein [Dehalococcoidia bacterium]
MLRFRLSGLAMAATVVISLLLVLLVEGCSTSPVTPGTSATAAPKGPYGSVTIAINFGTGSFDPLTASGATFTGLGRAIFDVLLEYNDDDKLVPGIAERWEIAPDGMSHTFYIRKGVKFHDGSDLTGEDVKFSAERMMSPGSAAVDAP